MENKFGMVGMGRIENGVMKFMDASGKGFIKPVVRREPAVINQVSIIEEEVIVKNEEVIDVPDFIKEAIKKRKQEQNKVVYVNFKQGEEVEVEEEEQEHPVVEALIKGLGVARKKMVNNPVFKYFFDDHEQEGK